MSTMPQPSSQPQSPPSPPADPEYVAIILAATQGGRLFPLTSEYPDGAPKHLLPVSPLNAGAGGEDGAGGATLLQRLLVKTHQCGFEMVVVAINEEDGMTVPYLQGGPCKALSKEHEPLISTPVVGHGDVVTDLEFHGLNAGADGPSSPKKGGKPQQESARWMHVRVVRLPGDCNGSADALRYLSGGAEETVATDVRESMSSSPSKGAASESETGRPNDACFIPRTSHAVVMPGDLILEGDLLAAHDGKDALSLLVQSHRRWSASPSGSAVTMLLTDVGAEDKEGVPLKESSKAKMGLLSREEEDMEYIGLSSEVPPPLSGSLASLSYAKGSSVGASGDGVPSRRVVLKRSKLEVEEDEGTGSTPKLSVPKRRLHAAGRGKRKGASSLGGSMLSTSSTAIIDHSPTISLRTDLHDVHVYAMSNWVFDLIHARPGMQSFQGEILPLLISRQYKGVEGAFGKTAWKHEENRERLGRVLKELGGGDRRGKVQCDKVSLLLEMYASGKMSGGLGSFVPDDEEEEDANPANDGLEPATPKADTSASLLGPPAFPKSRHPYAVSAQVLSREASALTLRACTLPSLLYGCSEITSRALKLDPSVASSLVAKGAKLSTKFNSILMASASLGEKVQTKSCTVGKNVTLGDRTRLNNVLVMDGATIGSNVVMQNSIVGANAKIGDNCNLKDCQVGPGAEVPTGTRTTEKGEAFHV